MALIILYIVLSISYKVILKFGSISGNSKYFGIGPGQPGQWVTGEMTETQVMLVLSRNQVDIAVRDQGGSRLYRSDGIVLSVPFVDREITVIYEVHQIRNTNLFTFDLQRASFVW